MVSQDSIKVPDDIWRPGARAKAYSLMTFIFLSVIQLLTHYLVYMKVNMMVDSDQPFMWLGIKDYADGCFYEPRFYGQDYNTFMEAFFAVPFYKMGMPVYYALPLATHLIFLTPVYFTAIYLFRIGKRLNALIILCIFLCLTPAFDVLSSLPRGFITGLFFSSFFILSFMHPQNLKYMYLNGLMLAIGFFVNPNVLIAGGPLVIFLLLHNYKRVSAYIALAISLLAFIPLYFIFDRFYDQHPDYVVYGLVHSFSPKYFLENMSSLDQVFGHVNFFSEIKCWELLSVFFILACIIYQRDKKLFVAYLGFLLILLLSFFTGKTREGTTWPYYSYSRMFVAIPMVIALFSARLPMRSLTLVTLIVLVTFTYSFVKLSKLDETLNYHTDHRRATGVRIEPLPTALDGLKVYKKYCDDNKVSHIVVSTIFWQCPYLVYGGPAIMPDFPSTEETWSDHRYWVREKNKDTVYTNFIVLSINSDFDKIVEDKFPFEVERKDNYGLFLIKNNKLKNKDFLDVLRDVED